MNQPKARAIRRAPFNLRAAISILSAGLLAVVIAIVLFTMLRSPLKDDVAWLLYVARRWLAGRELYVDVVEVNPPLIVWISAIPMQIAAGCGSTHSSLPYLSLLRRCWAAPGGPRRCCAAAAGCSRTGFRSSRQSAPCCWWCRRAILDSANTCWSRPSCRIWRCLPGPWTGRGQHSAMP